MVPEGWVSERELAEGSDKGSLVTFTGPEGVVGLEILANYSEWGWEVNSESYTDFVLENMEEISVPGTFDIWNRRASPNGGVYVSFSYRQSGNCAGDSLAEALVASKWVFFVHGFACQRNFSEYADVLIDILNSFQPTAYGLR